MQNIMIHYNISTTELFYSYQSITLEKLVNVKNVNLFHTIP